MEKVWHRTRGECTLFAQYSSFYTLIDRDGVKFEAAMADVSPTQPTGQGAVIPLRSVRLKADEPVSQPIDINNITAAGLANEVKGIGRAISRQLIGNRPVGGYKGWTDLQDRNPTINGEVWTALRETGRVVFNASS